jgi:hypothetical protein
MIERFRAKLQFGPKASGFLKPSLISYLFILNLIKKELFN